MENGKEGRGKRGKEKRRNLMRKEKNKGKSVFSEAAD